MNKQVKLMSVLTISLFLISILVYFINHRRGTPAIEGQSFITGLDIEKIDKFVLIKDGKELVFVRDADKFVLKNFFSYPTDSEKINDLLYKITNIQIAEVVTNDQSNHQKLKVTKDKAEIEVALYDRNETKTINFYIGDSYKGKGNYIRYVDKDQVFISDGSIYLTADKDSYIDKNVIKLTSDKVLEVVVTQNKSQYIIAKEKNDFILKGGGKKDWDKDKIKDMVKKIENINFTEFYPMDDSSALNISKLNFNDSLEIKLSNNQVYKLLLAKDKEYFFLKVNSYLDENKQQFVINKDDDQEKLRNIADVMGAQESANTFNIRHGKWIYKISKSTFEQFI